METYTLNTSEKFFYITAFTTNGHNRHALFFTFLLLYLLCIIWNTMILLVIFLDPQLQKPMYFFLRNLSIVDVLYISVALPKLMDTIITRNTKLSFTDCFSQMYFFLTLICTEIFLLTTMSYDRYIAICFPLHYPLLMGNRKCTLLVAGCWVFGISNSLFVTIFASYLSFCRSPNLNQVFCDIKTLTRISCGDTRGFQIMIFVQAFIGFCIFLLILMSYTKIILNILHMNSMGQMKKTFSTCTSHLTVLLIFYGTLLCMYMRPLDNSEELDQIFSVLYLAVTPSLNPLIYSLRNKEIKTASQSIFANDIFRGLDIGSFLRFRLNSGRLNAVRLRLPIATNQIQALIFILNTVECELESDWLLWATAPLFNLSTISPLSVVAKLCKVHAK